MYNPKQIYEAFLQPLSDTLDSDDQLKNLFLSYKMDLNNRATTWSKLVRSFARKKKSKFFFKKPLPFLGGGDKYTTTLRPFHGLDGTFEKSNIGSKWHYLCRYSL